MKRSVVRLSWLVAGSAAVWFAFTDLGARADEGMFGTISSQRMLSSTPAEIWTGPYVGLQIGYGWTNLEATELFAEVTGFGSGSLPLTGFSTDINSVNGGATLGYNLYTSSMVLGVEADVSMGDYIFSSGPLAANGVFVAGDTLSGSFEAGFNGFGTIRARAGMLISPQTLLYVTGGLALARTEASISLTYDDGTGPIAARFEDKNIEWGYAVGAGIEDKVTDAVSVKLEYIFVGLTENRFEFSQPGVTVGFDGRAYMHLVRLGVNYTF